MSAMFFKIKEILPRIFLYHLSAPPQIGKKKKWCNLSGIIMFAKFQYLLKSLIWLNASYKPELKVQIRIKKNYSFPLVFM